MGTTTKKLGTLTIIEMQRSIDELSAEGYDLVGPVQHTLIPGTEEDKEEHDFFLATLQRERSALGGDCHE